MKNKVKKERQVTESKNDGLTIFCLSKNQPRKKIPFKKLQLYSHGLILRTYVWKTFSNIVYENPVKPYT